MASAGIINMSIFVTLAQETQWEVHTQVSSSLEHLGGCDPSLCSSVLVLFMSFASLLLKLYIL